VREENKRRRPSADIMYILVAMCICKYIIYKSINTFISLYLGFVMIIFTDFGVRVRKKFGDPAVEVQFRHYRGLISTP
jgi:hypothetical protein